MKQLSSSSYLFSIDHINSLQSHILKLRVSRLKTISHTAYPIMLLLSVIWSFLWFSISIGSVFSFCVQTVLINTSSVLAVFLCGRKKVPLG